MIFQTYKRLLQVNKNFETNITCVGHVKNQSCLYKNLYYINRTFWILTTKKLSVPLPNVRIGAMVGSYVTFNRRRFYTYTDLDEFIRINVNPIVIPHLTVHFEQLWLMNIGHALFDGLYAAYVALIRFSPRHLQPFRILLGTTGINDNHSFSDSVYNRFAGIDTMNLTLLEDMSIGKWFAFEEIIIGSGDMCQRCLQPNLQLPGGIELNGSRLFRDRMYKQHGLIPPITRHNHSAERRNPVIPLNAVFINNKRFTTRDRIEIGAAIDEINMYTDTHRNHTKLDWPLIYVSYVSYSQISTENNARLHLNFAKNIDKMTMQLQLLKTIDIHITGPGTGQMYQTFLSDGSVNINLGGLVQKNSDSTTLEKYTSFMEQHMTAGTPYIKGLYYPINERPKGIKRDIVIKLIRKAAQLIIDGFALPVNSKDNLAPDGQLFTEMCEIDRNFCMTVTERWQMSNFWCFVTWPETIIYENRAWSKEGIIDYGKNVTCPYNRTLLNQLRQKYNIHFKYNYHF
ncbi:unnamed protein product [Adineta steineri]|uniref:Uncharacterized protein n=1 Tax=Adineta steineri TaxID=433720 RepID=A0A819L6M3_9BILA|nr:unnamed protein product [Adineta steineri]